MTLKNTKAFIRIISLNLLFLSLSYGTIYYLLNIIIMENNELIKQCTEKAQTWLTAAYDAETQAEVKAMLENPDKTDLIDAFYKDLEFGTGGLRGIMGAGSNRMNIYTVGAATQGLANYLNKCFAGKKDISVVVGHDCRNNSRKFAEISADIFTANGIKVYLFEDMRPTPEMSFAIRHLGCQSGINITASHNPKEYNGYKAYWEDGAQVLAPHDKGIIDEVNKITSVSEIKFQGNKELIQIVGKEIDDEYLRQVHTLSIDPEVIQRQKDLKIVYTPIHGTGMTLIPQSLKLWGFENVHCVAEQMVKSGDFPTVVSPNPENAEALTLAIKLAKEIDADIVMASDPDADRVGMACKDSKGEWVLINGNQTCLIFLYYIIKNRIAMGKMKGNEFIVKTIVTTELIKKVADKNHIKMLDCYTGFKWIAREIRLREGQEQYIGGGEESYGFLAEDFVRDKDAVSACSLLAEICAWAKDQGKTLYDVLMEIYVEYGFSLEVTVNVVKPGKTGADEIKAMMDNFRACPPKELGGSEVVLVKDYKTLKATDNTGKATDLDMPETSNVLQFFTADGTKVSVRPSGTEPKIKFYMEIKGEMHCPKCYAGAVADAKEKVDAVKKSLGI
jgi:phosphoglucomutase